LLNQEAAEVAGFDLLKHRTGSMRCQTPALCFTSRATPGRRAFEQAEKMKKKKWFASKRCIFYFTAALIL
jgi:hypothetical protein